jgi:hypothetical protein
VDEAMEAAKESDDEERPPLPELRPVPNPPRLASVDWDAIHAERFEVKPLVAKAFVVADLRRQLDEGLFDLSDADTVAELKALAEQIGAKLEAL